MGTKLEGNKIAFKNTGKEDLLIEFVSGGCDCTVVEDWPRRPIKPGEVVDMVFSFDATKPDTEAGTLIRTIDIISNTDPIVTSLEFKVVVQK
jgi:hypothetical protein